MIQTSSWETFPEKHEMVTMHKGRLLLEWSNLAETVQPTVHTSFLVDPKLAGAFDVGIYILYIVGWIIMPNKEATIWSAWQKITKLFFSQLQMKPTWSRKQNCGFLGCLFPEKARLFLICFWTIIQDVLQWYNCNTTYCTHMQTQSIHAKRLSPWPPLLVRAGPGR